VSSAGATRTRPRAFSFHRITQQDHVDQVLVELLAERSSRIITRLPRILMPVM